MKLEIYKKISENKTLYKPQGSNSTIDFVLVHNTDILQKCFVYDITIFWIKQNTKRCFSLARHKENLLENPELLSFLLNDNKKMFPCNAEHGWKDSAITTKDMKILEIEVS